MDLETLITVIIVFIVIIFQLVKRLGSGKKPATPGKIQTWKQKFEDTLSKIQLELEKAGTDDSPMSSDLEEAEAETVISAPLKQDYRAKRVSGMEELPVLKTDVQKEKVDTGIMDLQKAVIWSEILGPPLALRNERGDRQIK